MKRIGPQQLIDWQVPEYSESATSTPLATDPPTEADLLLVPRGLWEDDGRQDRSKRDFLLVVHVLREGGTPDAACRLLYAMPGSKAKTDGRGEDYWRSTLKSALSVLEEEKRAITRALQLPDDARDDPGAPFKDQALDDLLLVRAGPLDVWQRLRANLKKAKVGIVELEKALAARTRAKAEVKFSEVRFVAQDGKRVGWFARGQDSTWTAVDGAEIRSCLRAQGKDCDLEVKAAIDAPWSLVNEPFASETLPGRRWNKDAARLAHEPKEGSCPTWDGMLVHLGRGIDGPAREAGYASGADYLLAWCAARVQRPKERTAYLAFHGPQESGKSTLHEALGSLFTKGYVLASHAIQSREGFNGEVANAVLCAIEEVDLSDPKRQAHERVKAWVTGDRICVRAMYRQPVDYENATGWIQCTNRRNYIPVQVGDTRITVVPVDVPDEPVSREVFRAHLASEAAAFLHKLTTYKLKPAQGRLLIPALETADKAEQAEAGRSELEAWLADGHHLHPKTMDEVVAKFLESLPTNARAGWTRARVLSEFPAPARRARRLAIALPDALRGRQLPTSRLLAMLPQGVGAEWGSPIALGKGMALVARHLPWLNRVTIRGLDLWEVKDSFQVGENARVGP